MAIASQAATMTKFSTGEAIDGLNELLLANDLFLLLPVGVVLCEVAGSRLSLKSPLISRYIRLE